MDLTDSEVLFLFTHVCLSVTMLQHLLHETVASFFTKLSEYNAHGIWIC